MNYTLDKDYSFNNFTSNETNSEALVYAMAVADLPGFFPPLYIYGEEGCGKKHLLQAIANRIINDSNKKVLYISYYIPNETLEYLKDHYKDIDVLIIADIEYFIGKEISNDLLLDLINTFSKNNKQLVISSSDIPDKLKKLDKSIINKINKGSVIKVDKPNRQIKIDAIKHRIQELQIRKNFTQDAIDNIVDKYFNNLQEIDSLLYRTKFCVEMFDPIEVDIEFVDKCLKYYKNKEIIPTLVDIVCNYYGISIKKYKSNIKILSVVCFICKTITKVNSLDIAKILGIESKTFKDLVHEIYEEYEVNEKLREEIKEINNSITNSNNHCCDNDNN